ncbi:hypothetical protein NDK43_07635 [Neobacillus pocheonensis]|uniref:Uncharacterized protein n=1 Tax=Neobacillus pocheonensis TaxID=363869 RepID=A0ABT0WB93_9BACI|nr:hypothetical protein [Neobacillus pocheonensis]
MLELYTVLDKPNEQIIKDLGIQSKFHPYVDAAKKRMQSLVEKWGPHHDVADRFLEFLEDEYEYVEEDWYYW